MTLKYEDALSRVYSLMQKQIRLDTPASDELEILSILSDDDKISIITRMEMLAWPKATPLQIQLLAYYGILRPLKNAT